MRKNAYFCITKNKNKVMKVKIRHQDDQELEALRIEKDGMEFLIQDTPGGIKVVEITNESITIQPNVANAIFIVTK